MEKNWPEIVDMECIDIEKGDILSNGNDFIIANEENLDLIDDGINWRVIGSLKKGETLIIALERINQELL